jgi:polyisoprenoid-binding protein YceI
LKLIHSLSASTFVLTLLAAGCAQAPDSDKATVGDAQEVAISASTSTAIVDTENSKVEWVGTKVTGRHNGVLHLTNGSLDMKDGSLVGGNFTLDMTSLTTSDKMGAENGLTDHLKSADFFDVANHPTAEFVITGVKALESVTPDTEQVPEIDQYRVSNPTHEISGNLTIKGVTKNITFPAAVQISGLGTKATAKFNINRNDWGISYPGKPDDLIRETVHIGIALKASVPAS